MKRNFYIVAALLLAFTMNVLAPFFSPIIEANKIEKQISELSKIFGKDAYICDSSAKTGYLKISYNDLGKKEKQKYLSEYKISYGSGKDSLALSNYKNYHIQYNKKLHSFYAYDVHFKQDLHGSSYQSQAPPSIS